MILLKHIMGLKGIVYKKTICTECICKNYAMTKQIKRQITRTIQKKCFILTWCTTTTVYSG